MNLTAFRGAVADALAAIPAVEADDWTVHDTPVDALSPPAFVLRWGPEPWRTIDTVCTDTVQLEVVVVAARLTPEGENFPTLEAMADAAVAALTAAGFRPFQALTPGPLEIGKVTYLAARLQIRRPVTIGETEE